MKSLESLFIIIFVISCASQKETSSKSELMQHMEKHTKISIKPVQKLALNESLKNEFIKDIEIKRFKNISLLHPSKKQEVTISIPSNSRLVLREKLIGIIDNDNKYSIACFTKDEEVSRVYTDLIANIYKEADSYNTFGESSSIDFVGNTAVFNLNSVSILQLKDQSVADYLNFSVFRDNSIGQFYFCHSNTTRKKLFKKLVQNIVNAMVTKGSNNDLKYSEIKLDGHIVGLGISQHGYKAKDYFISYEHSFMLIPLEFPNKALISGNDSVSLHHESKIGKLVFSKNIQTAGNNSSIYVLENIRGDKYKFVTKKGLKKTENEITLKNPHGMYYVTNKLREISKGKGPENFKLNFFEPSMYDGKQYPLSYQRIEGTKEKFVYKVKGTPFKNSKHIILKGNFSHKFIATFPMPKVPFEVNTLN